MPSLLTPVSSLREHIGSTVLIVEDEFIVARDIQRRLEVLGYVVLGCVSTGDEAVARTRELKPDLVLIDISLRGEMDGIEAARRILENSDVAVVFATANSDMETFDRARAVSPSGFVLKPFDEREVGVIIDAALYKRAAERKLRENETRYRALFENSAEGLLLMTDVVLECNQSICRLLDLTKGDIIGRSLAQLAPESQPDARRSSEAAVEYMQNALTGKRETFRWQFRKGREEFLLATVDLQPATLNLRPVVQAFVRERPGNPEPDYARRELAAIVESSDDAIFSKDMSGTILSWNGGAERIYGYAAQEVLGRPVAILLPPEKADEIFNILARLRQGEHIDHFETVRVCKDGRHIDVSVTISPIKDEEGKVIAASTIARDITERKQAMERLENSLREKEFLLQEMHHRTKNNLQIVSSLLNMQARASGNEEVVSLVRQSQDRLNAMAMIHARLYRSSNLARVEFSEYLQGLISDLARSYGTVGIGLHVDADRQEFDVETAMSCGLIINELVTNAFKHAFPESRRGDVNVQFRSLGDGRYALTVSDNGIGMKGNEVAAHPSSLGLQLVESLVAQIGGRLEMDGTNGTTVRITFAK